MKSINFIFAQGKNGEIGMEDGSLPWGMSMPRDLMLFKAATKNNIVIMGRKTYESLGKPLPARFNIVISSSPDAIPSHPDLHRCNSMQSAIKLTNEHPDAISKKRIFVIGGTMLFESFFGEFPIQVIHRSTINSTFDGATVFAPKVDMSNHYLLESRFYPADENNKWSFEYERFKLN